MPKLILSHNHKGKFMDNHNKFLGKVSKLEIICQQRACTDTRSTKHNKHQLILMHAKRAHANKTRGIYELHEESLEINSNTVFARRINAN
jgi:hypothetical protein